MITLLRRFFLATGLRWLWLSIMVIALDRITKMLAITYLEFLEPLRILPIFNLTLAYNKGAAFSFLHSASGWQHVLLGGLAIIVSLMIIIWLSQLSVSDRLANVALCLILGGALGNAWDRVLYGHVVDFFDFHLGDWHFAIFNTADSAICIGAVLLCYHWFLAKEG